MSAYEQKHHSVDLSHIPLALKYRALENNGLSSGLLCKAQTNCEHKATVHSVFYTFTCFNIVQAIVTLICQVVG